MDITKEVVEIDCQDALELEFISNDRRKLDISNNNNIKINIDIFEEIPIAIEESNMVNSIETFKATLMSTIEKLYMTIDFLQKEIEERNFIIRTLFTKDTNGCGNMDDNVLRDLIETTSPILVCNGDKLTKNDVVNDIPSPTDNDTLGSDVNSSNKSANISLGNSNISIMNECHVQDNCGNYGIINRSSFIPEYESSFVSVDSNNEPEIEAVISSVHVKKSIKVQTQEYRNICHANYLNRLNNKTTCDINEIQKEQSQLINRGLTTNIISGIKLNNSSYSVSNNYISNIDVYDKDINANAQWKPGTTLIIGDSMLNGLDEKRLKNCKVRPFSGASVEDMHFNIDPLLRKKPSNIIMHVGCNNCVDDNSTEIMKKLTSLKDFILSQLDCKLIFSSIIDRSDDAKAQFTGNLTNKYLSNLGVDIINNDNITTMHLGRKGHHMTPRGTGRLAMNFIRVLKSL